ncbi:MAG: LamG domain-containing protein [bacterium]|nr:LamG domain-containing protein [bacterium]
MLKIVLKMGILGFLGLLFFAAQDTFAATLTKPANNLGLVGYWSFNDGAGATTTDFSGNGYHGTTANMEEADWVAGKRGMALSFDGTNEEVTISSGPTLTTTATIAGWFYWDTSDADAASLIRDNTGSSGTGWIFTYTNGTGLAFRIGGTTFLTSIVAAPYQNKWTHYAVVKNGSAVTYYLDGILAYSSSGAPNTANALPWHVMKNGTGGESLKGKADDIRMYNRALSASEVATLYGSSATARKQGNNLGLVGHWSLNDASGATTTDFSGNRNTGVMTNMDPTTDWVNGKFGKALDFDGTNDYVNIPSNLGLSAYPITLSAWVKSTNSNSGLSNTAVALADTGSDNRMFAIGFGTTTKAFIRVGNLAIHAFDGTRDVVDGQWHHLVGVFNSATDIRLYVDGALDKTVTTEGYGIGFNNLNIGRIGRISPFAYMNGRVDDVRVYNRSLSVEEIKALYGSKETIVNASQTNKSTSGLVGMWSFDGKDMLGTTTAYDRSGQGNNGTLTSGPTLAQGKVGQAINFTTNTSDYISVPDNDSLDFGASQNFSVSAWVKTTQGVTVSRWPGILGKDDNTSDGVREAYELLLHSSNIDARWSFALIAGGVGYSAYGQNNIADGQWHHLVGIREGSNIHVYEDGVFIRTEAGTTASLANARVLTIGTYTTGIASTGDFVGQVDEVRIYNRALSTAEVKQLYLMGR